MPTPPLQHEPRACDGTLQRAFGLLGKRWNGMILGTIGNRPTTFTELRNSLGISDSVLSDRLTELAGAGLVQREVEPGPPVTVAYSLTTAGTAVLPALDALVAWAEENLTEERCATARR